MNKWIEKWKVIFVVADKIWEQRNDEPKVENKCLISYIHFIMQTLPILLLLTYSQTVHLKGGKADL